MRNIQIQNRKPHIEADFVYYVTLLHKTTEAAAIYIYILYMIL